MHDPRATPHTWHAPRSDGILCTGLDQRHKRFARYIPMEPSQSPAYAMSRVCICMYIPRTVAFEKGFNQAILE